MSQLSLWLCPPATSPLRAFLTRLSTDLDTIPFDPHATLVSDEIVPRNLPQDALVALVQAGVDAWSRQHGHTLDLAFHDVRQGSQFYQCILAALVPSPALVGLHEALLAAFSLPVPDPPTYFPHLSLVYDSKLTHEDKAKVITDLEARGDVVELDPTDGQTRVRIVGEAGFSPLEVLLVRTQGPPPDWEVLARVPLGKKSELAAAVQAPLVMLGTAGAACEGEMCDL